MPTRPAPDSLHPDKLLTAAVQAAQAAYTAKDVTLTVKLDPRLP